MKIEGKELSETGNLLDKVTYVPGHAEGNASHKDCEQGVIIGVTGDMVSVLYCKSRTVQKTDPADLVFG